VSAGRNWLPNPPRIDGVVVEINLNINVDIEIDDANGSLLDGLPFDGSRAFRTQQNA